MPDMEARAREYEAHYLNDPTIAPPPVNISAVFLDGYREGMETAAKVAESLSTGIKNNIQPDVAAHEATIQQVAAAIREKINP